MSGMVEKIIFKFKMLLPLCEGHFHSKFGATWTRHHGAADARKPFLCFSSLYTHGIARTLFSWAA